MYDAMVVNKCETFGYAGPSCPLVESALEDLREDTQFRDENLMNTIGTCGVKRINELYYSMFHWRKRRRDRNSS